MNPTAAQQGAIDSSAPNILVVAGPGAGKSSTTVARIKRLIAAGTPPAAIVALSYTNAAANVLQERLGQRLGFTGTLHGFALKCLKEYGEGMGYGQRIAIVGEEAAADLLASKAQSLGCKTDVKKLTKLKATIHHAAGRMTATEIAHRMSAEERVIRSYYAELRESGMVDFDTILTEFLRLVQVPSSKWFRSYSHLFVDEVQDSALIDWQIYEMLPIANKFMVGDQDQSIFGFRGGRPDLMAEYSRRPYVETHLLEENFRSHSEICEAAQRLIEHNADRIAKETVSVNGPGGAAQVMKPCLNAGEEAALVATLISGFSDPVGNAWLHSSLTVDGLDYSEIAILARTNDICAEFREQLKVSGIPVAQEAKPDLPKDWTRAKALVELLVNPSNDTLAAFYLAQNIRLIGVPEAEARRRVHGDVLAARRKGVSLNDHCMHFARGVPLADIGVPLAASHVSAESRMRIVDIMRKLPAGSDMLQLALAMGQETGEKTEAVEGVVVTTLHGSKGREWDVVFLVGFEDEILPGTRKDEDVAEARRLAYVGLTRARKQVFISYSLSRRTCWGAMETHKASRFIKEAGL